MHVHMYVCMYVCTYVCTHVCMHACMRGNLKIPGIAKKNLFTIFEEVRKFSPLQSTTPVTGCSVPSAALTTGHIIQVSRGTSGSRWTSATSTYPDSSLGTKQSCKDRGQVSRGWVGHNHHFVCSQNRGILLTLQWFNENCWQPLTAFPLKILDKVSSSRHDAGMTASSHRMKYFAGD